MSCPGGACGKDGLEQRMILYGILAACLVVGVIWISGYRKTAYVLVSIPVAIAVAGPQLSRGLDRVTTAVSKRWRAHARLPGRQYCPECARALGPAGKDHPAAVGDCPKCGGSWCDSRKLLVSLAPYGTVESTWQKIERDELTPPMLCPQCAVPLELGTLDRLQPLLARCAACDGHWIARMTWTWFELNPAPVAKAVRPTEVAEPELVLRKSA
ncbi:MAG: hypothetical protein Q8T11_14250 [Elusimicrobiota bacterium]|nr:hypothetical protein [Elusimicrobiota bacterium]